MRARFLAPGLALALAVGMTLVPPAVAAPQPPAEAAGVLRNTEALPGFINVYRDSTKGRLLLGVRELDQPFLFIASLPWGLGSNEVGLDRGQSSPARVVRFRRAGNRLLLVQDNTGFRATSGDPAETLSARQAFPEAVLWAGDIQFERGGELLFDADSLLRHDHHGVAARLKRVGEGTYQLDAARSALLTEEARAFPDNTELEALLTFQGEPAGRELFQVAADARSVSLRQHLSFVRLPGPGFQPRTYHPASGGLSTGWLDFGAPLTGNLAQRVQLRFRLERQDPAAASGPVKQPIVFYVDRGAPEPVRTALLDGARWWQAAFEKAGFEDAYRVELLPEGADPMDVRYSIITWAHRSTRGWSYGHPVADPRTGEIIKGSVTLGSQRVRQDLLIAEALLAPYDKPDAEAWRQEALDMALARVRQLAAHEVGHALGFDHNFATSRHGNGSVMDYPHPVPRLDEAGRIRLDRAYGEGIGPWDEFLVAHAYGEFPPAREAAELATLRRDVAARGLRYINDTDARPADAADPDGNLWDFGADTLASYDLLMQVRARALAGFGPGVLPPGRQLGELEARLVPVYLLHRYQIEAVARLLAGVRHDYGVAGENEPGTTVVDAATQKAALERVARSLSAEVLAVPDHVLDLLTPPAGAARRDREYFSGQTGPLFDPSAAAAAAAAHTTGFVLAPGRINRLAWQHARDPQLPGVEAVLATLWDATWGRPAAGGSQALVQAGINDTVTEALLHLAASSDLHAVPAARVRAALQDWNQRLSRGGRGSDSAVREAAAARIAAWLKDPSSVSLRSLPELPPGAPI